MKRIITIFISLLTLGILCSSILIYKNQIKTKPIPTTIETLGNTNTNSIWIGTFQLAWNELINNLGKKIEFENYESKIANNLNQELFSKEMLSSKDYYIAVGRTTPILRNEIENNLNNRFKITDYTFLDKTKWNTSEDTYTLFSYLNKNFEFEIPFDYIGENYFNKDLSYLIHYFGINNASSEDINKNVKVLFYDKNSYAVILETKEDEEVILYYDSDIKNSFEESYNLILKKSEEYKGNKEFKNVDELTVPYISIDELINYDELCGHYIKDTSFYIINALQSVKFELNEKGGNLVSEANIVHSYNSGGDDIRFFHFNKPFMLFLKEKNSEKPYLSLYVENCNYLK